MNICLYTDYTLSAMTGGIGSASTVITNYFRKEFGWKVYSIFAFQADKGCVLTETDGSIQLRLHDRLGIRRLNEEYKKATLFIKSNNIELVIVQTSMDVVARLRKKLDDFGLKSVKVVSVLHYTPGTDVFLISKDDILANIFNGKFSLKTLAKGIAAPIYNYWEYRATITAYKKAYRYGNKVIVLSESYIPLYQKFSGLVETSKLIAIPNCIPFEHIMTPTELQQKENIALVVGRMVDFPKRISKILKMWKQIESQPCAKSWSLVIVGDGPDLEKFKALAIELNLSNVKFEGRQNPFDYYKRASIFFMASDFEGFPMTLVEAQQMGCVPISFDSFDSLHEVIKSGKNGIIVPKDEIDQYIAAALMLMKDISRRKIMAEFASVDCKKYQKDRICQLWKEQISLL